MEKFANRFEEFEGEEREEQQVDIRADETLEERFAHLDSEKNEELRKIKDASEKAFTGLYNELVEAREDQEVPNKGGRLIELDELLEEKATPEQSHTSEYEIAGSSVDQTYLEELFGPESETRSPREIANRKVKEYGGNQELFKNLIYPEYVTIDSEEALEDYETLT